MKAMILAAGDGMRLRPLTATVPKPMLRLGGKPLLQYQVERLTRCGVADLVINHARLGPQIEDYFRDGRRFGARIRYSPEGESPLGTAMGIRKALPLLGPRPFLVVNADIWCEPRFERLRLPADSEAHLLLVPNPGHRPRGDFRLAAGKVSPGGQPRRTYAGVGIYSPRLFAAGTDRELACLLRRAARRGAVSGALYRGPWADMGTPERLRLARRFLPAEGRDGKLAQG